MKRWIDRYATSGLATSTPAGQQLFGQQWGKDNRWQIHHAGINLSPFRCEYDKTTIRRELGIPENALIIGHIGSMSKQKNHLMLLHTMQHIVRSNSNVRLLLVGTGPLLERLRQITARLQLTDYVIFLGSRSDVPKLLIGAMDVVVMPSQFEGLGMAALEAQAAGRPVILSEAFPAAVCVVPELTQYVALNDSPKVWALKTMQFAAKKRHTTQLKALSMIAKSPFNIEINSQELCHYYRIQLLRMKESIDDQS